MVFDRRGPDSIIVDFMPGFKLSKRLYFYPKRIHITTTTYTLPVVGVGETILLTFDVSACQMSNNSTQSVTWRAANGTNSFAAASTTNFDSFGYGTGTRIASIWLTGVSSTRADIRG